MYLNKGLIIDEDGIQFLLSKGRLVIPLSSYLLLNGKITVFFSSGGPEDLSESSKTIPVSELFPPNNFPLNSVPLFIMFQKKNLRMVISKNKD